MLSIAAYHQVWAVKLILNVLRSFSLCEIIVFRNCTRMSSTRLQIVFFVLLLWILGDQLNDLFDSISTLCCFQGSRSVWRGTFKIIRIWSLLVNDFFKVFWKFFGSFAAPLADAQVLLYASEGYCQRLFWNSFNSFKNPTKRIGFVGSTHNFGNYSLSFLSISRKYL